MFASELLRGWLGSVLTAAGLACIFVPLEHYFRRSPQDPRERQLHLVYLAANFLVWTPLTTALLYLFLGYLPSSWFRGLLAGAPRELRFLLAILACDTAVYWFHRASHRYSLLWRIHRVHHTPVHLDWLAAYREHPLDNLLTRLVENLPFALLSVPLDWLLPFATFRGLWAVYIHSNVRLSPGAMGYLLGAPELHHVHHECAKSGLKNFANLNPLMDLLFGTFEKGNSESMPLGLPEKEFLPSLGASGTIRRYLAELRCSASRGRARA